MYKKGYIEEILDTNLPGKVKCPSCKRMVSTLFATSINLKIGHICFECKKRKDNVSGKINCELHLIADDM